MRSQEFKGGTEASVFTNRNLATFASFEVAYHQLMIDIVWQQTISTQLVLSNTLVQRIFVDGGFSKNAVFMNLLASSFPDIEVYGASIAQASALGAGLAIHKHWNTHPIPGDLIEIKYYAHAHRVVI